MGIPPEPTYDVNRRHVLGIAGIAGLAGIGFRGWLSNAEREYEHTCHYSIMIQAVAVANLSSDETVYDAEADGFIEIAPLADVLNEAHSEYQDGKAVDTNELDDLTDEPGHVLAQQRVTHDILMVHDLMLSRPLVEYRGQIYQLSRAENDC